MTDFLFTSDRLGFRNWKEEDIEAMIKISADPLVMKYFPATARPDQTRQFIQKMQTLFQDKGYCYFACIELASNQMIGFIGLAEPGYEAEFTPCVDIGWRLSPEFWGKSYATEGAKRCLEYGFETIGLSEIVATAPLVNQKSIRVMEKIGMTKKMEFKHPLLSQHPHLHSCVCYSTRSQIKPT